MPAALQAMPHRPIAVSKMQYARSDIRAP
jgi:hypothetical protein